MESRCLNRYNYRWRIHVCSWCWCKIRDSSLWKNKKSTRTGLCFECSVNFRTRIVYLLCSMYAVCSWCWCKIRDSSPSQVQDAKMKNETRAPVLGLWRGLICRIWLVYVLYSIHDMCLWCCWTNCDSSPSHCKEQENTKKRKEVCFSTRFARVKCKMFFFGSGTPPNPMQIGHTIGRTTATYPPCKPPMIERQKVNAKNPTLNAHILSAPVTLCLFAQNAQRQKPDAAISPTPKAQRQKPNAAT